uniref:Uncharacterized protein n=1 Tax=Brassica oleracea TaxID=3712 RepID=A0A3P6BLU0_BRAOL|nr:unnamed protein product [Brassica oleracea]
MRSTTITIRRSSTLSMRGGSCAMTRNGALFQALETLEAQKEEV